MKALIKSDPKPGLVLRDVAMPTCGDHEVLIRIDRTGICGTDLHIYKWDAWAAQTVPTPLVIGHEFVGEIVELGSGVEHLQVGDIVSGEGHLVCGRCRNCLAGRRHLCKNTVGVGIQSPGAFAEYLVLPQSNVWKHDPGIDRDVAAIFDPYGNATHTALKYPVLGEDVLITGAGPIGCMAAAICRHAGARNVVVTDVNPKRLELANSLGATRIVDVTKEKIADIQKELGMTEGFDVGLEMSGNPQAFGDMIGNMAHGGKIALLGILEPGVSIDWNAVVFRSLTITGIYGREMFETWYQMTAMLQSGLDITPVITHHFGFEDFEQGFEAMTKGSCGKVILHWS